VVLKAAAEVGVAMGRPLASAPQTQGERDTCSHRAEKEKACHRRLKFAVMAW
jgi:hypothetical protein